MSVKTESLKEALTELRKNIRKRNFNQSIELVINLRDIDVKNPEGRIQEVVELPHPIGKKVKICVFATGDMALRARRSGADLVLDRDEVEGLANDKKRQRQISNDIDSFISAAPLMPIIGRVFGSILGPKGKMPTPVAPNANIESEIERHRRIILVRTRGQPVLQCRIGTEDMSDDEILENVQVVLRRVEGKLKRGVKNIGSIYLKATMGPPVKMVI